MIRKSIIYIAAACMALGLGSCSDDLNTSSSVDISDTQVLSTATGLNMLLEGNYNRFYFKTCSDDFRQVFKGVAGNYMIDMVRGNDVLCDDNLGGEQYEAYQYVSSFTLSSGSSSVMWTNMYNIINQCNIIIDNIDNAKGSDETKSNVKGQALAMRAYCYFQLVQFYQQTYAIAKEKAGVPLRLSSSDAADLPRSTVSACYEQIVNDLTTAKSLLVNFDRGEVKYYLNKDVVNGILARVYLVMNEWEKAKAVASEAFSNYSTLMTRDEWRSGFCHASYSEIMWGYYQTTESNMGDNGMFSFWYDWPESTGEPFYNFNNYFANSEYEALFEKTDDRYLFWHRKDAYTDKWAYSKFYDPGDGNAKSRGDYVLMRGSEMLLIMAECDAQLGNTTEALSYLNQLQKARNVKDLTTATAKNDLLESIYVERRKELLGEGGGGMLDYLRLQKPLVRTGDHFAAGMSSEVFPLASNDYRFIFQIPQREIQLNNSISESDQNPFSGQ